MSGTTIVNMFTAQKEKLHGMKSSKWTTKDKIVQYKGLINLYTRDRKIIDVDTNVTRKKLQRELKDTSRKVHTDRKLLDNAIRGDKQQLRNNLAEHRELQLAYQNSQPEVVALHIKQKKFTKRKELDKLLYNKRIKSQELTDLKLELSVLEDRLKYAFLGQIQEEKYAPILTGKVQDAVLRREAAWAIHHIYTQIIDIMKKDALYFDAIIASITADGYAQSRCALGATKLGQLATEYLDDRRQEYDTLEKLVIKDMATRKKDIRFLNEQVENSTADLKKLLRKDSDVTMCCVRLPDSQSMEDLKKDVAEIEGILRFLKDTTAVPSFEDIFPCFQEQRKQEVRLKILHRNCTRDKDILQNKLNHAGLMKHVLINSMLESTAEYKARKKQIIEETKTHETAIDSSQKLIDRKHDYAAKLRVALAQLLQLTSFISTGERKKPQSVNAHGSKEQLRELQPQECDGLKILEILAQKLPKLMKGSKVERDPMVIHEEFKQFEALMRERMLVEDLDLKKLSESSLLQGLYTEANLQLLTREELKRRSQEIVEENTKNDDLVPMFVDTKRKKFKK